MPNVRPRPARAHFASLPTAAAGLAIFRSVLAADETAAALLRLLRLLGSAEPSPAEVTSAYAALFALLADEFECSAGEPVGDAWQNHLLDRLLADDNPFSRKAQVAPLERVGPALVAQVERELAVLEAFFRLDARTVADAVNAVLRPTDEGLGGPANGPGTVAAARGNRARRDGRSSPADPGLAPLAPVVPWDGLRPLGGGPVDGRALALKRRLAAADDWRALLPELHAHYAAGGAGLLGRYRAFRWRPETRALEGIAAPDPVRLADLVGYEAERALLLRNTEHFVAGFPANNVLLYGDRGTGKSSTIKALLNEYGDRGLRMIEVPKEGLGDFPLILRLLRQRPERFVLFVDDLSFEEGETAYKSLKAVLEGGLEVRPPNVVLYATSNRRHLVSERFSDRLPPQDGEVRPQDVLQEKLSLADRFGLTLVFVAPDQERYLAIVAALAAQRGLSLAPEELRRRALRWTAWQNARSGRTARQFVDFLAAELALAPAP